MIKKPNIWENYMEMRKSLILIQKKKLFLITK
jgi:hypothetical protein